MNIVDKIKDEIAELQLSIKNIQDECSHPESAVTKKHGSNTGNYCEADDCYWTDFECNLCGKRWQEDGSK